MTTFQEGNLRGPLAEFAGCSADGHAECGARLPEIAVVRCRLGAGDLTVNLPRCVVFEAAHDLPFARALRGALCHVLLGPLAGCHPDQDHLIEGMIGVAVAPSAKPVARCGLLLLVIGQRLAEDDGAGLVQENSVFAVPTHCP